MPPRLTDAQVRNAREQALRAVRRGERKLDTAVEVMERRMDRSIENKERITMRTMDGIIREYRQLVGHMRTLEGAITDATIVFTIVTS